MDVLKDLILNNLAEQGSNIAQFVSFGPDGSQRFARLRGYPTNHRFQSIQESMNVMLSQVEAHSVSVRTFLPQKPDGNPFDYGIMNADCAASLVRQRISEGYYVIINETIRLNDGGFSGVLFGSLMEVAPNDTPRCVEKPGCMRLPRDLGFALIRRVYGCHFHVPFDMRHRIEFSVHPYRLGYRGDFIVVWQVDLYDKTALPNSIKITWPNKYSLVMGDKAFGLLIADLLGFPVPRTTVFGRVIPQFHFGTSIGNNEQVWVRTVPKEQSPGKFQTLRGYHDPFEIMQTDDPDNIKIAAIIIQEGVPAKYSGSTITDTGGAPIIEGCRGYGDQFMIGIKTPESLPAEVKGEVNFLWCRLQEKLGDIRFEWVYDGEKVWVLQLHLGRTPGAGNTIFPGEPKEWWDFQVKEGLEVLRRLVEEAKHRNCGIILHGDVGLTSHFGDILRKAMVPSKLVLDI